MGMIKLNSKTQQDFLNREWVQKLLEAGVDMSDAKYYIATYLERDWVNIKEEGVDYNRLRIQYPDIIPTYTVSELLYKLHEWICLKIDDKEYSGPIKFLKDAPFYAFYYDLKQKDSSPAYYNDDYICSGYEYPIESLAGLLIQCHKKGVGDTGNISDK